MTGPRADQRRATHHGALDAIGHCRLLPDVPAGGGVLRVYSRNGYRRAMCSSEQLPQHPRPIAGALDAGAVIPGAVNVRLRQGVESTPAGPSEAEGTASARRMDTHHTRSLISGLFRVLSGELQGAPGQESGGVVALYLAVAGARHPVLPELLDVRLAAPDPVPERNTRYPSSCRSGTHCTLQRQQKVSIGARGVPHRMATKSLPPRHGHLLQGLRAPAYRKDHGKVVGLLRQVTPSHASHLCCLARDRRRPG